jgi:hypothetical protein
VAFEQDKIAGARIFSLAIKRSGIVPDLFLHVGIGTNPLEVEVLHCDWPEAKWLGIEPNKETADSLIDYPGDIMRVAAGQRSDNRILYKCPNANESSLFVRPGSIPDGNVDVVRLADHLPPCRHIAAWLDCEGCELEALAGMGPFLECVFAINIELTKEPKSPIWPPAGRVTHWLHRNGFRRFAVHSIWDERGIEDAIFLRTETQP